MLEKGDRAGAADRPTLGNQGQEIASLWAGGENSEAEKPFPFDLPGQG